MTMMDLNQTRVFVEVVRAGGFAAAARRLGLPKSTVSARVQALEARLGAQLLKRSTRHLSLTAEGSAFFETVVLPSPPESARGMRLSCSSNATKF